LVSANLQWSPGAAIANAVANACGVRVPHLPLTPDHRVLGALQKGGASRKCLEYTAPDLREVLAALSLRPGEAEILAGGTDLVTCLKQGLIQPLRLVSLRHLRELRGVSATDGGVRIGAMTTLGEISENPIVRDKFPALVTAITGIGSPQLLAVGTLGGDLCQRPAGGTTAMVSA
jgi:CO/xanthine dehydrogenase FAD-binding subunit